jgi:light-regulated signal transduction histidine kinase (bacteriophytochrome)
LLRLEQQAAARDATGKDTPLDDAHSLENGKLDDTIRRIVSTMTGKERERLETNQTDSRDRLRRGELVGGISGAAACALLLIAFGLLSREVLQRRRAEASAQTALNGAEVLNRELEAFSYSVSHDLRAPLRSIDGFSQALLEDYHDKLDDEGKQHLARVRAASQRMAQLIDDLLGLSRVTRAQLHVTDVDLSAVATACAEDLRDAFPDREIQLVIASGLKARGDARLLRIVFDNLLGNAFKFTARRPRARIEIGVQVDDDGPAYFVKDDGVGFDSQYGDKLFGAFQRLHDARDFAGTGIGLATVQRIVRRHGGRIWATSEVDHGAIFRFTLGDVDGDPPGDS